MAICTYQGCTEKTRLPYLLCWHHRSCIVADCGKPVCPRDKYCSMHRARLTRGGTIEKRNDGRSMSSHGYVRIFVRGKGYRYEHRLMVEFLLGRKLRKGETVHHKNGDKSDNSPDNLSVMSQSEHMVEHHSWARDRKHIVNELLMCSSFLKCTPSYREFVKWLGPNRNFKPIKRLFGSWRGLLSSCGLTPRRS